MTCGLPFFLPPFGLSCRPARVPPRRFARAGIRFEVIPGVSAALAAPAAAGIPVTHRGLSASVTIVNGHDADQHDWAALARSSGTLVFLMAVEHLEEIADNLQAYGRSPDEAAAVVQWATTRRQRVASVASISPCGVSIRQPPGETLGSATKRHPRWLASTSSSARTSS